ncbi:MAG: acetamidase/formamidase family protein [Acidobacteria bacterium]|nr:acetamidase/formamidase family protein [Acidobacteriota bacterium]
MFDPGAEPALIVCQGETFIVETEDAHCGTITGPEVVYRTLEEALERIGGVNPVTGPIYVEGVRAGDCVEIEIGGVDGAPVSGFGYMTTTPTLHPDFRAETVICRRRGDQVEVPTVRGPVLIPYRPFVGTLGVAPAAEPIESFLQGAEIMGNVDLPEVTTGATVVIRANVDGALISLGDAHLAQGDAEIHRSAIESQADVEMTVRRRSPEEVAYSGLPQINTAAELGSVAPGPGHLEDLVRAAYDDLASRINLAYGFTLPDAYRLLGAVGTVRIGQVVPPLYSAMAKIERRFVQESEQ